MQFLSLSLLIPIAYLGILVGSLATFSKFYRQRQLNAKLRLAPYFPPHQARNLYLSLMHLPEQDEKVKVPDSVLRAALLNRAVEDAYRILEIQTRKMPLNQLLQRGVVGEEMWNRMLRAEQELEAELKDVVAEAEALSPNWGQSIFQSAGEMARNRLLKESLAKIHATVPKEKEVWNAQREKSRRELEDGDFTAVNKPSEQVVASTPEKPPKTGSSDEDGVIVDSPAGTSVDGSDPASKNKKKKNKK